MDDRVFAIVVALSLIFFFYIIKYRKKVEYMFNRLLNGGNSENDYIFILGAKGLDEKVIISRHYIYASNDEQLLEEKETFLKLDYRVIIFKQSDINYISFMFSSFSNSNVLFDVLGLSAKRIMI